MSGSTMQPRIDVHAHLLPDFHRTAAASGGYDPPDGVPALPRWDTGAALAMVDPLNIRTAMLSIFSPGVRFGDDQAVRKPALHPGKRAMAAAPG